MRLARGCMEIYNHRRLAGDASGTPEEMDAAWRESTLRAYDSCNDGVAALAAFPAHTVPSSRVEGAGGRSEGVDDPEHDSSTTPWPACDFQDERRDSSGTSLHRSLPTGRTKQGDEKDKEEPEKRGGRWKIRGRLYHRSRVHLLLVAVVLLTQMFVNIRIDTVHY
ncbi:hypothetical protein ZHAS_00022264 [Anopheles sinensis]|uniref:Uncharacterized protein n=1 Tax=Anopheles sinensis TaxID=74873 RepID=A0A084WUW6_ANOSI|nr:hypothetical protein ZHAS_00022264 [Anopheles sinensis]